MVVIRSRIHVHYSLEKRVRLREKKIARMRRERKIMWVVRVETVAYRWLHGQHWA